MSPENTVLLTGSSGRSGTEKPLCVDLFCGLGGWAEGFLVENWQVIGFDIERHDYGMGGYPGQLVIQDVLTLHGKQFKDATIIVGSSPCQEFSYRAMPWKRAKALPPPYKGIELFQAQFRIQREASEAAGRHIPLVVENVKGAQPWVGRAKWHYGSFFLWGDAPALMPYTFTVQKFNPDGTNHPQGSWFKIADSINRGSGRKAGRSFQPVAVEQNPVHEGVKQHNSKFSARKAASAQIAKIPFALAQWIARTYRP